VAAPLRSIAGNSPEMGQPTPPYAALLLLAAFSRHPGALEWSRRRATEAWGAIALEKPPADFSETDYYQATMGSGLRKSFFVFDGLFDPARLSAVKRQANRWEEEYRAAADHAEPRPLNLDPGYLTLGKLVLASTKNHAHRIYLAEGIYAEVTLFYRGRRWQPWPWTYADYRRDDYHGFFDRCREYLRRLEREGDAPCSG
jgi:hypothetical protein